MFRPRLKRAALLLGLLLTLFPCFARAQQSSPALSGPAPQVLLYTTNGMMLLELDHINAPTTTAHILGLAQAGLYDGVNLFRSVPDAMVHFSDVWDTPNPRTPQLWTYLPKMPLENARGHFQRGAIALTSASAGQGGGVSSFVILLQDMPSYDGLYTVFGHLRAGFAVAEELSKTPEGAKPRIIWAQILPPDLADRLAVALDANEHTIQPGLPAALNGKLAKPVAGILTLELLLLAGALLALRRISRRHMVALVMMTLMLSLFALVTLLQPSGLIAGGLAFVALLIMFRLMSSFENMARET